ncbi:MAG TPA: GNAT family N-acetyltransferase [Anaerolineaceae bacterium]|nr:GNAT family N-acetyltransferase [Anaerolineaceae bacterium]
MSHTIRALDADGFLDRRGEIVEVYRLAFAQPPYYRTEVDAVAFSETLLRHVNREGFRSVIAVDDSSGRLDGFVYGYTSRPGQWWYDVVTRGLSPEFTEEWITGSFEIVELAVRPEAQGQKLGSGLHDTILQGLPHHRAVLSTMDAETVAVLLYRSRGWMRLIDNFQFPGVRRPYQIMGLDLNRMNSKQ